MSDNSWLKNLKPGDTVVVNYQSWSGESYKTETVEKITPIGLIRVAGNIYTPRDGWARNGGSQLMDATSKETERCVEEYKKTLRVKSIIEKMRSTSKLTYDQAMKIKEIMQW